MKKIIVLLLVSGFFTIPISCVEEEQVYSIQQLGLRVGKVHNEAIAFVEPIPFETTTDTLSSADFGIEIFVEEYELISENLRFGNPFISSAYAPPVIPKEVDDELALLRITSSDTLFISGTYLCTRSISDQPFPCRNRKPRFFKDHFQIHGGVHGMGAFRIDCSRIG